MSTMRARLTQIKRTLQSMGKTAPEFMAAFQKFKEATEKEGALDVKTKKLIAIGLSISENCEWCIAMHTKEALDAGATAAEIMEVVFLSSLMGGAPSLMLGQLVMQAVEEFSS
ncbi:MAG: carboxymuconolactone decarboxylase family protein [Promethearchaeota archaeon]